MTIAIRLKSPGGADQLELVEIDLPAPGLNEIRVHHTAIGVNFIDIYQRTGLYPLPSAIPGVEAVGIIESVGEHVSSLRIGDRIAYGGAPVGAYASARNLPEWRAIKIPDALSDDTVASAFVKGITAHMLLTKIYPVAAGTTILLHAAAGGLGQLMTRWATHLGSTVIGLVGSEEKAALVHEAGAHHVIVGRDADFIKMVSELTGGRGVDVVYDGVGGDTLAKSLACVRPFGVAASIGQAAGPIPPVNVEELGPRRSISLSRPSVMAYMNAAEDYRDAAEAVLTALIDGILVGKGRAYPLANAAQAHRDLESGRTIGSLYLVP